MTCCRRTGLSRNELPRTGRALIEIYHVGDDIGGGIGSGGNKG